MLYANLLLLGSLTGIAAALPQANAKRQISKLRDNYDFIVAGGGTTGLTIADRLSEAFPNSKFRIKIKRIY
jgi:choline dehydrogenase